MNDNVEKKTWAVIFTLIPTMTIVFLFAFGKQMGWNGLVESGILKTTLIIFGLALLFCGTVLAIAFKGFKPEKHMQKAMKKKNCTINRLCYSMMQFGDNYQLTCSSILLLIWIFIPLENWGIKISLLIILLITINILLIKYHSNDEFKSLALIMEYYIHASPDTLKEEINASLKNGLHYKSNHLVITADYIIGRNYAIPKSMIASLCLEECKPEISYRTLKGYREMCTLMLVVSLNNDKKSSIQLGSNPIELKHIRQFLTYYNETDPWLQGKYKGLKTINPLQKRS